MTNKERTQRIVKHLKQARVEQGLSQEQVAKRLRITSAALCKRENSGRLELDFFLRWTSALKVRPSKVLSSVGVL